MSDLGLADSNLTLISVLTPQCQQLSENISSILAEIQLDMRVNITAISFDDSESSSSDDDLASLINSINNGWFSNPSRDIWKSLRELGDFSRECLPRPQQGPSRNGPRDQRGPRDLQGGQSQISFPYGGGISDGPSGGGSPSGGGDFMDHPMGSPVQNAVPNGEDIADNSSKRSHTGNGSGYSLR